MDERAGNVHTSTGSHRIKCAAIVRTKWAASGYNAAAALHERRLNSSPVDTKRVSASVNPATNIIKEL